MAHPERDVAPVWNEELVVVSAVGDEAPWEGTEDQGMLVFPIGCSYRAQFETWWIQHALPRPRVLELGSIDAILRLAAAGVGLALVQRSVVATSASSDRQRIYPIEPDLGIVRTYAVTHSRRPPLPAISAFLQHVRDEVHSGAQSS